MHRPACWTDDRRVPVRRRPHAVREVRRSPGRRPPRRPGRDRPHRGARPCSRPRPGRDRRCPVGTGQRCGRGQPQRGPDGGAPRRAAGVGAGRDGQPAVRLEPRGARQRSALGRERRRRGRRGRRRGVDDKGALGAAEAGAWIPRGQRGGGLDHVGVAAGQRADARRVDNLAGRVQRASGRPLRHRARAPGRVRGALAPARPRRLGVRLLRRPRGAGRRGGPGPRRGDPAGQHRGVARRTQAVLPARRHDHRRQRFAAQRRCGRPARRFGGGVRPGSDSRRWRASPAGACMRWTRRCSASLRSRPRARRSPAPASGWADVAAVELNEAFAVQSLACVDAWVDAGSATPRS